ncbi:MAG: HypC/HybG/HupF family hydrogenase formation chaperone [Alphaproteobacteria bacterium]
MCLAAMMQIVEILDESQAIAEMNSVRLTVNIDLLDNIQKGDYILVHVGMAIAKVSEQKAKESLERF